MILQALTQHYEALRKKGKVPSYGFSPEKTAALITISPEGKLLQITPLTQTITNGKKSRTIVQTREVPKPYVKSVNIKANFLYGTGPYLLGVGDAGKETRTAACYAKNVTFHKDLLEHCTGVVATAILRFYDHWIPDPSHPQIVTNKDLLAKGALIFEVAGHGFAHDDDEVRQAWITHCEKEASNIEMVCLVTGHRAPIIRIHDKVKGIRIKGPTTPMVLIGFKPQSTQSYEREQGLNAPISEYAGNAYITALNYLLGDSDHSSQIGDATVVYWAENDDEAAQEVLGISLMIANRRKDDKRLHEAMQSIARALPPKDVDLTKSCHIVGFSPNIGRISVRFYLRNSLGGFLSNINAHYQRLEIAHDPADPEYLSPWELLRETVNPYSEDEQASPLLAGAFLRSILQNTRYPAALYQATLLRLHAVQDNLEKNIKKVSRGRAAILKACLLMENALTNDQKEALTPMLNEDSTNKAYVLGRLFAVLENAQQTASPNLTTTIKNRYFSSACMTPRTVFSRLLQLNQHHMNKISNEGAKVNINKRIGTLMDKLDVENKPFPAYLSLQDQGLFVLGYYQQTQSHYRGNKEEA